MPDAWYPFYRFVRRMKDWEFIEMVGQKQVLQGAGEEVGVVKPAEERGGVSSFSTTPWKEVGVRWGQSVDRTRGHSLRLCQKSFRLDIRRNFFIEMIAKYWNWLPRRRCPCRC